MHYNAYSEGNTESSSHTYVHPTQCMAVTNYYSNATSHMYISQTVQLYEVKVTTLRLL